MRNIKKWLVDAGVAPEKIDELAETHVIVPRTIGEELMGIMRRARPMCPSQVLRILVDYSEGTLCPYCDLPLDHLGKCKVRTCPTNNAFEQE